MPSGMNDRNEEDMSKYIDISHCSFLVDSSFPTVEPTEVEPDLVNDEENWEVVKCVSFLDNGATGLVGRLLWIPDLSIAPTIWRRVWGRHCLLRARQRGGRRVNL